ncbi:hypothetical protein ACEPAF_8976 [Sanghuangporus sanghuang]
MVLRALFELFRRYHDNPAGTAVALFSYKNRSGLSQSQPLPNHRPTTTGIGTHTELADRAHRHKLNRLLSSNAQWAADVSKYEPEFFTECAKGQAPKVLWIGCADSRVPESVIMACKPGEIFVHRNIANQFHLHDDSAQSVLTYAVEHLGVEHVVVVGHTQCGGVAGAYDAANKPSYGKPSKADSALARWLGPLVALAGSSEFHASCEGMEHGDTLNSLSEANVRVQVENICNSDVMRNVWARATNGEAKKVYVHGWIYELQSGRLRDLGVSQGPEGFVGPKFVGGVSVNGFANTNGNANGNVENGFTE